MDPAGSPPYFFTGDGSYCALPDEQLIDQYQVTSYVGDLSLVGAIKTVPFKLAAVLLTRNSKIDTLVRTETRRCGRIGASECLQRDRGPGGPPSEQSERIHEVN